MQGVKYYLIDPNNRLQPNYSTAVYPGDPGFRGLKYPGEFLSYDVPGYGTLTIGDKYYLQSEQVLSEYVSFEVMERIGNFGTTRGWTENHMDQREYQVCAKQAKEKVQDMQVGTRPYVYQRKANSLYEYNIG